MTRRLGVEARPIVSVLLVTYNHAQYVRSALDSIGRQTGGLELEIVVADDCSTDDTLEIVTSWSQESPLSVRILPAQPRLGITLNYARGFAACRGEYVAVLEGDDQWSLNTKLVMQVDALRRHPQAVMVANRLELFDESEGSSTVEPLIGLTEFELLLSSERLAESNWFATFSTCMFRRSALELLPPAIFETLAYDWAVVMAITQFGPAVFLPEIAVSYRIHPRGTWSQQREIERDRQLQLLIPDYVKAFEGRLARELHRSLVAVERRLLSAAASAGTAHSSGKVEVSKDDANRESAPRTSPTSAIMWDGQPQEGLVSVVVPCFNHEKFVGRAIQSILNQTYQEFEIIVVDDASSDASLDVVRTFSDLRIRSLSLSRNVGGASALNLGIQQARGEYVAILNSDDMWAEEKLERQVAQMVQDSSIGAVFTGARFIDIDDLPLPPHDLPAWGEIFRQRNRTQGQWLRHFFENGNVLCHPSILARRSTYQEVGLYDNTLRQLPDFERWISLVAKAPVAVLGDEPLVLFRLLPDNGNTSSVTPASVRRGMREHLWISERFFAGVEDSLIVGGFGDLLDEPNLGPGIERECDIAIIHLRSSGPLQSINREIGLRMISALLRNPDGRLILHTKYGIDDRTVHDRAGSQELALTSEVEGLISDFVRPLAPDPSLPSWSTGMLVRLVISRIRAVPMRLWASRVLHHIGPSRSRL